MVKPSHPTSKNFMRLILHSKHTMHMQKYIWNVNIETEEIIPLNDGAKKMMDIVEFYD